MKLSEFDYYLPNNLIAQEPISVRDFAKLLVLDLRNDTIEHLRFHQLPGILTNEDLIVLNDTRVLDARLFGHKPTGGKIELLILDPYSNKHFNSKKQQIYDCLIKGKVRPGMRIKLAGKSKHNYNVTARIIEKVNGGRFKVEFESKLPLTDIITNYGHVPLPPYIKKKLESPERYQTVYSANEGSVAAPTAGLHFTPELITNLKTKGVSVAYITLHISYGTFTPVRTENITQHQMDKEYAVLNNKNAEIIKKWYKSKRGRFIAVGTTTVRTLETIALHNSRNKKQNLLSPWKGWSELFIYPGFEFKAGIDTLLTNFHLPKSTLLMLVSAFAGRDNIFKAYQEAIEKKYRFYSFGDAMMIIK